MMLRGKGISVHARMQQPHHVSQTIYSCLRVANTEASYLLIFFLTRTDYHQYISESERKIQVMKGIQGIFHEE